VGVVVASAAASTPDRRVLVFEVVRHEQRGNPSSSILRAFEAHSSRDAAREVCTPNRNL
jgi:hypothetical protein